MNDDVGEVAPARREENAAGEEELLQLRLRQEKRLVVAGEEPAADAVCAALLRERDGCFAPGSSSAVVVGDAPASSFAFAAVSGVR
ncbi:hypothetical protein DEO72_LG2g1553 [Vigna unguiculata]|uniref:Uncharacterized protein n=1 Tax=Vigna unguiculata TaxID=3917 RepID=A0A4D6KU41_VIGUN|nr:hypothetical protein DEO72_LG2g1553 [Vigna unguiculata]